VAETIDVELANATRLTSAARTGRASISNIRLYKVSNFLIFICG